MELTIYDVLGKKIKTLSNKFENTGLISMRWDSKDQNGHRVGYGKGFYDGFLARFDSNTLFVGVCHFDEPSNIEDLSEQDVPLHYIITPKRIYKF